MHKPSSEGLNPTQFLALWTLREAGCLVTVLGLIVHPLVWPGCGCYPD